MGTCDTGRAPHLPLDRETWAEHFQHLTAVSRKDIFGAVDDSCRPLHLQADAATMFAGYVGEAYRVGHGIVILPIIPGGGGDAYKARIPEDEELYPLLVEFKNAYPEEYVEAFERINRSFARVVKRWNLWRIVEPTLAAANCRLEDVAYMNVVPYRTRGDKMPSVAARRVAWTRIVVPTLALLGPRAIIALGKKAGSMVEALNETALPYFCVPRTIGDAYVSEEAKSILASVRTYSVRAVAP